MDSSTSAVSVLATFYKNLFFRNRLVLILWAVLYIFATLGVYFFEQQRVSYKTQVEVETRQNQELDLLRQERNAIVGNRTEAVDIFRRLSFNEVVESQDKPKLQTSLSLNSLGRYALAHHDFQRADDAFEESLGNLPTFEAEYYLGVLDYLKGDNEGALGLWQHILAKSGKQTPSDILLYSSLAAYRMGDSREAQALAGEYSKFTGG